MDSHFFYTYIAPQLKKDVQNILQHMGAHSATTESAVLCDCETEFLHRKFNEQVLGGKHTDDKRRIQAITMQVCAQMYDFAVKRARQHAKPDDRNE